MASFSEGGEGEERKGLDIVLRGSPGSNAVGGGDEFGAWGEREKEEEKRGKVFLGLVRVNLSSERASEWGYDVHGSTNHHQLDS